MDHEYEAVFRMGRLRSHFFSSGEGGGGRMTLRMRLEKDRGCPGSLFFPSWVGK